MSKPNIAGEEKPPIVQVTSPDLTVLPKINSDKLMYLIKETGMEHEIAKEFLESNGWNVDEALDGYKKLVLYEQKADDEQDQRNLSTYDVEKRKVSRGFSLSNFHLIQDEREKQKTVVCQKTDNISSFKALGPSAQECFVLPDISSLDKDVANIIKTELISRSALLLLTSEGRLNWWSEMGACRKLFPLSTVGDGNCLLHAVSLGMWGFHDRMLILRKALHQMLLNPFAKKALKRRWKYSLWKENMTCGGLTYTHEEWENEWEMMVKLASNVPYKIERTASKYKRMSRQHSLTATNSELQEGESLDSLETIHVYALANLLCRPIIIISTDMLKDADGRDIAPIPFGGIYLPFEQDIGICYKYPLVLAYESSHFSALVPADGDNTQNGERLSSSVPLQKKDMSFLPIKFAIDPGSSWDMVQDDSIKEEKPEITFHDRIMTLRKYLDVVKVPVKASLLENQKQGKDFRMGSVIDHVADIFNSKTEVPIPPQPPQMIIAAKLNTKNRPKHYKEMIANFIDTKMVEAHELRQSVNKCSNCNVDACAKGSDLCEWCIERKKITKGKFPNNMPNKTAMTNNVPIDTLKKNKLKAKSPKEERPMEFPIPRVSKVTGKQQTINTLAPSLKQVEKTSLITETKLINQGSYVSEGIGHERSSSSTSRPVSSDHCPQPIREIYADEAFKIPGKLCKASGCKFYGSKETLGFCSSCYRHYNNN